MNSKSSMLPENSVRSDNAGGSSPGGNYESAENYGSEIPNFPMYNRSGPHAIYSGARNYAPYGIPLRNKSVADYENYGDAARGVNMHRHPSGALGTMPPSLPLSRNRVDVSQMSHVGSMPIIHQSPTMPGMPSGSLPYYPMYGSPPVSVISSSSPYIYSHKNSYNNAEVPIMSGSKPHGGYGMNMGIVKEAKNNRTMRKAKGPKPHSRSNRNSTRRAHMSPRGFDASGYIGAGDSQSMQVNNAGPVYGVTVGNNKQGASKHHLERSTYAKNKSFKAGEPKAFCLEALSEVSSDSDGGKGVSKFTVVKGFSGRVASTSDRPLRSEMGSSQAQGGHFSTSGVGSGVGRGPAWYSSMEGFGPSAGVSSAMTHSAMHSPSAVPGSYYGGARHVAAKFSANAASAESNSDGIDLTPQIRLSSFSSVPAFKKQHRQSNRILKEYFKSIPNSDRGSAVRRFGTTLNYEAPAEVWYCGTPQNSLFPWSSLPLIPVIPNDKLLHLYQDCGPVLEGKLCLVLDLDNTLLHACSSVKLGVNIPLIEYSDSLGLPELYRYTLPRPYDKVSYYLKLRPYVRMFLSTLAPFFEMSIYTNATREYADAVLAILDPDRLYFGERIIARKSAVNNLTDKCVSKLYPSICSEVIVALDDRRDVWVDLLQSQVIQAEHYAFFDYFNDKLRSLHGSRDVESEVEEKHGCAASSSGGIGVKASGTPPLEDKSVGPDFRQADVASCQPSALDDSPCAVIKDPRNDSDEHLVFLADLLLHLHETFFSHVGVSATTAVPVDSSSLSLVGRVLSSARSRILSGCGLYFTGFRKNAPKGCRALGTDSEQAVMELAMELGASVCKSFSDSGVTHVVAAKLNTENLERSRDKLGESVFFVHVLWLYGCSGSWSRVRESEFPITRVCDDMSALSCSFPQSSHWMYSTRHDSYGVRRIGLLEGGEATVPILKETEFLGTTASSDKTRIESPLSTITIRWHPTVQKLFQMDVDCVPSAVHAVGSATKVCSSMPEHKLEDSNLKIVE